MKRIILLFAVTALLMVALAVPAFADPGGIPNGGNSDEAQWCHDLGKWFGFPPGQCTSFYAQF